MTPKRNSPAGPRVTVIGAGSWGTSFGKILADGGAQVTMWARRAELAHEIDEAKRNSRYLPGINLPRTMSATHELAIAMRDVDQVYLSVPSQSLRENLKALRPLLSDSDAKIVSLMKAWSARRGCG